MIIAIFIVSGIYGTSSSIGLYNFSPANISDWLDFVGPTIWDTGLLTALHLDHVDSVTRIIPNIGLNESFMVFGALALAFNIFVRSFIVPLSLYTLKILTFQITATLMSTVPALPQKDRSRALCSHCFPSPLQSFSNMRGFWRRIVPSAIHRFSCHFFVPGVFSLLTKWAE